MKQIYHFEAVHPPILTERMLRQKAAEKKLKLQTAIVAVSGLLLELSGLILAIVLLPYQPLLSLLCFLYTGVSISGAAVIATVFTLKRRSILCQSQS